MGKYKKGIKKEIMKLKRPKRLESIIENDRLLISAETSSLISYDLKRLLDNYFNVAGEVYIKVSPENDYYKILIESKAVGIKSFSTLK